MEKIAHEDLLTAIETKPEERGNPLVCIGGALIVGALMWASILAILGK